MTLHTRHSTGILLLALCLAIASPSFAGKSRKRAEPPAPAAPADGRIDAIADLADRQEYDEALRLLDELLSTIGDAPQKQQLEQLRATLHGHAEYKRWSAIDKQARQVANRREFAAALDLARSALEGLRALDLSTTGDSAADLAVLRGHVQERVLELELAIDSERLNELTASGPFDEAVIVHARLTQRIDDALGTKVTEQERGRLLDRQQQLEQARRWIWEQIFKESAMLVIDGKRDEGRVVIHRIIDDCPYDDLVDKARRGLVQMDQ